MTIKFGNVTAYLEDGRWSCMDIRVQTYLNSAFPQEMYPDSPADGVVGTAQATAAVNQLKGSILPVESKPRPGRVY